MRKVTVWLVKWLYDFLAIPFLLCAFLSFGGVSAFQPKSARNIPGVEQAGFFATSENTDHELWEASWSVRKYLNRGHLHGSVD